MNGIAGKYDVRFLKITVFDATTSSKPDYRKKTSRRSTPYLVPHRQIPALGVFGRIIL